MKVRTRLPRLLTVAMLGLGAAAGIARSQPGTPPEDASPPASWVENAEMRLRLDEAEARAQAAEARFADQRRQIERLKELLELASKAAVIEPVAQVEFADGAHMMLLEPMSYQIGNTGVEVTVPAGFVHDNASIPQALWSLLPPHGTYGKAAIVHDYLYWAQPCEKRVQADNLLMLAMLESGVGAAARTAVYRGVRLGGGGPYKANRNARDQGAIRVVPANRRRIPATATWEAYQSQLVKDGVRDPAFPPDTGFCALGNDAKVPDVAAEE